MSNNLNSSQIYCLNYCLGEKNIFQRSRHALVFQLVKLVEIKYFQSEVVFFGYISIKLITMYKIEKFSTVY